MKVTKTFLMLVLMVLLGSIVGIHWYQTRESAAALKQMSLLNRRQAVANSLILDMEKYRRASNTFRKIGEREAAAAKDNVRGEFKTKLEELERLDPSTEEKTAAGQAQDQLSELLLLSARIEPTLYGRDFYIKQEARDLHDSILSSLQKVANYSKERQKDLIGRWERISSGAIIAIAACAGGMALIALMMFVGNFLASTKPSQKLLEIARTLREGAKDDATAARVKPLKGLYGEIESVLRDLASTVRTQKMDRHRFIVAVAGELRPPLVALQAGMKFLEASESDPASAEAERHQAGETVRRSMVRLSSALEDLSDLVDSEQSHLRLEEKIVDLRVLLQNTAKVAGTSEGEAGVRVSLPPAPVWTHLDPQRIERVLVALISKVSGQGGGSAEISVERRTSPTFKGLEILIQESRNGTQRAPSSPHQDLLKHWVSENGFGMGLAQKIVQAHGGTITAAGVAGTGLQFAVRLPAERVATGTVRAMKPASSIEALAFGG